MKFIILLGLILAVGQVFGQGQTDGSRANVEKHVADYVQKKMAEWSKKGEFESVEEWKKRIKDKKDEKEQQYVHEILEKEYGKPTNITLGEYDAEKEYFVLKTDSFGNFVLPAERKDGPSWREKCYIKEYTYGIVQGKVSLVRLILGNGNYRTAKALPFDKETGEIGKFYWQNGTWEYESTVKKETEETEETEETQFTVVEDMPIFPKKNLSKWFAKNVIYPQELLGKGISGKVYVQFVIEKDGSVTNVRIIRSVNPILDKEAIRVVKSMPKWIPARSKGKPVRCAYTVPVPFNP